MVITYTSPVPGTYQSMLASPHWFLVAVETQPPISVLAAMGAARRAATSRAWTECMVKLEVELNPRVVMNECKVAEAVG